MPELGIDPNVFEKPDDKDYDSAGYDTSTESLASSIYQYLFENGRRYHSYYGTEEYFLPTNETEQDRYVVGMVEQLNGWSDKFSLDLHHEIMTLAWENNLYKAPLTDPRRILDIGTGTRIWGIDMAEKSPNAEVIGTDLSPVQPNWAPQNWYFEPYNIRCKP
ncbi:hypothetical protein FPQ18DRAFT_303768 [Pyronema domesticum]|nr:hypothetical protein FPQ18DRAFT_303768 [Pyronema domesticum]